MVSRQGVVIVAHGEGEILHLEPAAGLEITWGSLVSFAYKIMEGLAGLLERLTDHFLLLNSAVELPSMNKVELLFEDPWFVGIIDYERQIWRYTGTN